MQPSLPDQFESDQEKNEIDSAGNDVNKSETDAREVFHRMAGCWTYWGYKYNYFDTEDDARAFYDELCYMLANQMAAPNSPQWFNTGLNWAYGLNGPQGHYYVDPKSEKVVPSVDVSTSSSTSCMLHTVGQG